MSLPTATSNRRIRCHWGRYGLKVWIDAAKRRLHHNVLAIALANKLARIAVGRSPQGARIRTHEDACEGVPAVASYEQAMY
jgi:hypothetical protein